VLLGVNRTALHSVQEVKALAAKEPAANSQPVLFKRGDQSLSVDLEQK